MPTAGVDGGSVSVGDAGGSTGAETGIHVDARVTSTKDAEGAIALGGNTGHTGGAIGTGGRASGTGGVGGNAVHTGGAITASGGSSGGTGGTPLASGGQAGQPNSDTGSCGCRLSAGRSDRRASATVWFFALALLLRRRRG